MKEGSQIFHSSNFFIPSNFAWSHFLGVKRSPYRTQREAKIKIFVWDRLKYLLLSSKLWKFSKITIDITHSFILSFSFFLNIKFSIHLNGYSLRNNKKILIDLFHNVDPYNWMSRDAISFQLTEISSCMVKLIDDLS